MSRHNKVMPSYTESRHFSYVTYSRLEQGVLVNDEYVLETEHENIPI